MEGACACTRPTLSVAFLKMHDLNIRRPLGWGAHELQWWHPSYTHLHFSKAASDNPLKSYFCIPIALHLF